MLRIIYAIGHTHVGNAFIVARTIWAGERRLDEGFIAIGRSQRPQKFASKPDARDAIARATRADQAAATRLGFRARVTIGADQTRVEVFS